MFNCTNRFILIINILCLYTVKSYVKGMMHFYQNKIINFNENISYSIILYYISYLLGLISRYFHMVPT